MADVRRLENLTTYVEYQVNPAARRLESLTAYVEYQVSPATRRLESLTVYIEYRPTTGRQFGPAAKFCI